MGDGTRVLAYLGSDRASRADDAELQRQLGAVRRLCDIRGWEVVAEVFDVEPARRGKPRRPALASALDRVACGAAECVVVTELGRLCHSVADLRRVLEDLDRVGGRLVSLDPPIDTGTEHGRLAARVLCAVSRWERTRAAQRSRAALAAARERGALQPAIEPELRRRIVRMRRAGMTLQAIVDELNGAGVPTVRGGAKWRPSSVQAAVGYRRPVRS